MLILQQSLPLARTCPRFECCNAPFCPALGGRHLKGEPVCPYLLDAVKTGHQAVLDGSLSRDLAERVGEVGGRLLSWPGPVLIGALVHDGLLLPTASAKRTVNALRVRLQRSAMQGSRIDSIRRARTSRKSNAAQRLRSEFPRDPEIATSVEVQP
jgi:hypothetical protein